MRYALKSIILVGLFTFSGSLFAQTKNERFEQFKKEMDLSDNQVLKIKAIKDKYNIEREALKDELDELRKKEIEEIHRLYTPEQKAKLKIIIDRHRAQKNSN